MRAAGLDRAARVGDQIQRELAAIIARELDDPRIKGATVSGVKVSRDLRHARVFVTPAKPPAAPGGVEGPAADRAAAEAVLTGLRRAAAHLRRRLSERVHLKYLPQLDFSYDPTLDEAERVEALLAQARRTRPEDAGEMLAGEPRRTDRTEENTQANHEPTEHLDAQQSKHRPSRPQDGNGIARGRRE